MTSLKPTLTKPTKFIPAGQPASHLRILLLGDANVGKTRFSGESALDPRVKRTLVVNFEPDGTRSLRHVKEKLDVYTVDTFTNDLVWLREYLTGIYRRGKPTHDGGPKPDVIVLDSLHQAYRMAMEEVKADRINTTYEKWVSAGSRGTAPLRAAESIGIKAERLDYNGAKDTILALLVQFSGYPAHLICVCNDAQGEEDADADIAAGYRPDLPRALAGSVPGLFSKVMWLTYNNRKGPDGKYVPTRTLLVRPQGRYLMVKDRGDDFPVEALVNPTMTQVFDYLLPTTEA